MSSSQIQVETVSLASLRPYARNARHHSPAQIKAIAASIAEFGITNPPLIDEHSEIIAGHGRIAAAQKLKLKTLPIIRILGLSETQKRALRLADNKLALNSSWSTELLARELEDLTATEFDITLTGFDIIEIDKLTTPSLDLMGEDPPLPEPPVSPVSREGDIWSLGDHRLIVGDARDPSTYLKLVGQERADMVITDPPYNVPIAGHVSSKKRARHDEFRMASGEMSKEQFSAFLTTTLSLARDVSRAGSLHYVFADWRMIGTLTAIGDELYSSLMNIAVWAKPNGGMGSFYRSQYELIAIFKHGDGPYVNNIQLGRMGRYRSNVWQYPGASGFSKSRKKDLADHPTVKPVALLADAIRDASCPGDLVLDPFGGSGSTLMAAQLTKRRAALIEIEPKFADVTCRRFHEHTGIEPALLPDMTPLSQVRAERWDNQKGAA
jgi:DNA modification methylase